MNIYIIMKYRLIQQLIESKNNVPHEYNTSEILLDELKYILISIVIFSIIFIVVEYIIKLFIYQVNYQIININSECPICITTESDLFIKTKCNHIFHKSCIDKWLNINSTCPYCRTKL